MPKSAARAGSESRKSREDWIHAALSALEKKGLAGVRVEVLARTLGVTKGSFYWHFKNRKALLSAALDYWENAGTQAIIDRVERNSRAPRQRMLELWNITSRAPMGPELAIRDWARSDKHVRARVERIDRHRLDYLNGIFRELGYAEHELEPQSLLVYSLLIGAYFIHLGRSRTDRERTLLQAVELILR